MKNSGWSGAQVLLEESWWWKKIEGWFASPQEGVMMIDKSGNMLPYKIKRKPGLLSAHKNRKSERLQQRCSKEGDAQDK